ncbi:transmembrane protein 254 [Alosa pseudoharengus]|uniref:transmembrane protein 254 n=1 Tax=Alosa sapidissima TaxID=34773 RepID=UPI001C09B4B7|nr:transmembrane protein 254 [Alosa sapidissima]
MAKTDGSFYFQRSGLFWIVTVTLSMSYYTWTVFWSEAIPYERLGPLGSLTKYLVDNHYPLLHYGWWLAWAIHFFEAVVAMKICSDKGVGSLKARCMWFVQTFLFGFASLGLLIKYKPDHLSKED